MVFKGRGKVKTWAIRAKSTLFHCQLLVINCLLFINCQDQQAVKRDQYLAEGFGLYQQNCANCHGKEGKGLAGLYPPIVQEYLTDKNQLSVWIKQGIQDSLQIDGKLNVRPMPGNAALKDLEIAEIVTYVTNTFGKETALWPTDSVVAALEKARIRRVMK